MMKFSCLRCDFAWDEWDHDNACPGCGSTMYIGSDDTYDNLDDEFFGDESPGHFEGSFDDSGE